LAVSDVGKTSITKVPWRQLKWRFIMKTQNGTNYLSSKWKWRRAFAHIAMSVRTFGKMGLWIDANLGEILDNTTILVHFMLATATVRDLNDLNRTINTYCREVPQFDRRFEGILVEVIN
jgi:hypothetical protein